MFLRQDRALASQAAVESARLKLRCFPVADRLPRPLLNVSTGFDYEEDAWARALADDVSDQSDQNSGNRGDAQGPVVIRKRKAVQGALALSDAALCKRIDLELAASSSLTRPLVSYCQGVLRMTPFAADAGSLADETHDN